MEWYYLQNGEQKGPVSQPEIFKMAVDGGLKTDDMVWNKTVGQTWIRAGDVPTYMGNVAVLVKTSRFKEVRDIPNTRAILESSVLIERPCSHAS